MLDAGSNLEVSLAVVHSLFIVFGGLHHFDDWWNVGGNLVKDMEV